MVPSVPTNRIIAFCHIEKASGTTLVHLLRRNFGLRHINTGRHSIIRDGERTLPSHYGPEELRKDLRIYPFAASISSHHLRPFVDFQEFQERLSWYTILRDPIKRLRSQYLYETEVIGRTCDVPTWMTTFIRDDVMVRKLAGERDLEAAKEILSKRIGCVGLQEHFDESLLLMRQRLGLRGFSVAYGEVKNKASERGQSKLSFQDPLSRWRGRPSSSDWREVNDRALDQVARHADLFEDANQLDKELYDFAASVIWPKQVDEYGGQSKLSSDVELEMGTPKWSLVDQWHLAIAFFTETSSINHF